MAEPLGSLWSLIVGDVYRWWSNPTVYDLQPTPGNITLTVSLTPDHLVWWMLETYVL